jgi:hypothetical protein
MRVAAARAAWHRWLTSAGPWSTWSVCPALLSPGLAELALASERLAPGPEFEEQLAESLRSETRGTLVLLDIDPALGVQTAATLYRHALAHPVLVLPRWPYARAVLPVESLVEALLRCAPQPAAAPPRLPHVVFVVDGARATPIHRRSRRDARADNRTQLGVHDLPNLRTLRARGIQRLVLLKRAPA